MEKEIEKLEQEVTLLKKKISILEAKENKRQAFKYLKIFIKLALTIVLLFGIWKGYNYVVNELPNIMEDKINDLNPIKKG